MSEQGRISIAVGVDSTEAISGLGELQNGLKDLSNNTENFGETVDDEFKKLDRTTKKSADQLQSNQSRTQDALAKTGKQARTTGNEIKQSADDSVQGLDELKDSAGDSASAMSGIAGAVSVVNPELGTMISNASALSGGIEGAAKGAGLFKNTISALSSPVGLIAVGVLGAGAALFAWSKRARGATIDTEELEGAIEALDAAQKRFMSTKIELSVLQGQTTRLRAELQNLSDTMKDEFADSVKEANDPFADFIEDFEDAKDKVEEARLAYNEHQKAMEDGTKVGNAASHQQRQLKIAYQVARGELHKATQAQEAAMNGDSEAAKVRRDLINGIEEEEERRRKILQIRIKQEEESARQSKLLRAQADNDIDSIREVSMEMAIQGDLSMQAAMQMLNYGAAMAKAALSATGLLGPALAASMAAIDAQLSATKEQILIDTRYNSILQDNLRGTQRNTAARAEAGKSETDLAASRKVALDMLAQARGDLAVIEREEARSIIEINALRIKGALSEAEAAELIAGASDSRREAESNYYADQAALIEGSIGLRKSETQIAKEEFSAQFDAAQSAFDDQLVSYEQYAAKIEDIEKEKNERLLELQIAAAQEAIQTIGMVSDTIGAAVNSFAEMMLQDLANEEAQALEMAAGNMEEQEKIKAEFEQKRQQEMARVFAIQQGVEIANVAMTAASASMAALGPPPTGLGPVLGQALIPLILGTAAAQIATISAQKPAFHQGGMISGQGDQTINAQGGEAVLNQSAVNSIGGASAVESLNSGRGSSQPVVIELTYKQKVLDRVVADSLRKGGPLKNALNKSKRAGKRGRVGGRL